MGQEAITIARRPECARRRLLGGGARYGFRPQSEIGRDGKFERGSFGSVAPSARPASGQKSLPHASRSVSLSHAEDSRLRNGGRGGSDGDPAWFQSGPWFRAEGDCRARWRCERSFLQRQSSECRRWVETEFVLST